MAMYLPLEYEYHFAKNANGSVIALTEVIAGGYAGVAERYEYSHLGERAITDPDDASARTSSACGNPFGFAGMFFDNDLKAYISVSGDIYRPEIGKSMSAGLAAPESLLTDIFAELSLSTDEILALNAKYSTPVFRQMGWVESALDYVNLNNLSPKTVGILTTVGGIGEMISGIALWVNPFDVSVVGSRIVGTIALVHGFDTMVAGLSQTATSRNTRTVFASEISAGLEYSGMSRRNAEWWGNMSDTAVGFIDIAAGAVNIGAKISKVNSIKRVRALYRLSKMKNAGMFTKGAGSADEIADAAKLAPKSIANRNLTKAEWKALYRQQRIARGPSKSWATGRKNYWKNIAQQELDNASGMFSQRNIERMSQGLAPKIKARLVKNGRYITKDISMELHHKFLPQRGGSGLSHSAWNLEQATPWAHSSMDPFRHIGYELDTILKGVNSF